MRKKNQHEFADYRFLNLSRVRLADLIVVMFCTFFIFGGDPKAPTNNIQIKRSGSSNQDGHDNRALLRFSFNNLCVLLHLLYLPMLRLAWLEPLLVGAFIVYVSIWYLLFTLCGFAGFKTSFL